MTATDSPLTVAEVAHKLRLSKSQVYDLCERRELDHYRMGSAIRIPPAAVESYLNSNLITRKDEHGECN